MTVSERLQNLIESSQYTYEKLGAITGIPKSNLQRYATGATGKIPISATDRLNSKLINIFRLSSYQLIQCEVG